VAGSHRRDGFSPDSRGAVKWIAKGWRPGDIVLYEPNLFVRYPVLYYASEELPPGARALPWKPGTAGAAAALSRAWIVWLNGAPPDFLHPPFRGLRIRSLRRFPGAVDFLVALAEGGRRQTPPAHH